MARAQSRDAQGKVGAHGHERERAIKHDRERALEHDRERERAFEHDRERERALVRERGRGHEREPVRGRERRCKRVFGPPFVSARERARACIQVPVMSTVMHFHSGTKRSGK